MYVCMYVCMDVYMSVCAYGRIYLGLSDDLDLDPCTTFEFFIYHAVAIDGLSGETAGHGAQLLQLFAAFGARSLGHCALVCSSSFWRSVNVKHEATPTLQSPTNLSCNLFLLDVWSYLHCVTPTIFSANWGNFYFHHNELLARAKRFSKLLSVHRLAPGQDVSTFVLSSDACASKSERTDISERAHFCAQLCWF